MALTVWDQITPLHEPRVHKARQHGRTAGRFPPPWTVDEATESFCIRGANGQVLAYVYFEDEVGQTAIKLILELGLTALILGQSRSRQKFVMMEPWYFLRRSAAAPACCFASATLQMR
jgi:hypothetical protein